MSMDPRDAYLSGMLTVVEHVEGFAHDIGCLSGEMATLLRLEACTLRELYTKLAADRELEKEQDTRRGLFHTALRKDGLT